MPIVFTSHLFLRKDFKVYFSTRSEAKGKSIKVADFQISKVTLLNLLVFEL